MRRPHAAIAVAVALLLWLAVLTVAFHGCGSSSFSGCRSLALVRRNSVVVSLPRKMLLAVASLDVSSSSAADRQDQHRHHHHHHHHHHHQHKHQHKHHRHAQWNRQGIPPSAAATGEIDPRYGVQKRLVPTGPNPLHH